MAKKNFVQTCTATINYTDVCGKMEKREIITFMVEAESEEEAKQKLYMIQKNAYLTFGNGSDILEVPSKTGKNV